MTLLKNFFLLFKNHKGKIFVGIISTLVFLFLLFPFDDLSDLVSVQVSKLSGNTIYLQFQKLKMSLFPQPGLKMESVYFESVNTPAISIQDLKITPSVSGLIYKKPYGQVSAQGLFKGDVDIALGRGSRSEAGAEREKIEVKAQKVSLLDLKQLAGLPLVLKGQLNLNSEILADPTWKEQPEMDLNVMIQQFELPPASVPTPMGPLTLPELKLGQIDLKGKLSGGNFVIEKGQIGKDSDELHGTIKGSLGVQMENRGGLPSPHFGSYSFEVELKVKKSFQDKASTFLIFLDGYKSPAPEGALYKFKVSGGNFMMPPSITALR